MLLSGGEVGSGWTESSGNASRERKSDNNMEESLKPSTPWSCNLRPFLLLTQLLEELSLTVSSGKVELGKESRDELRTPSPYVS